MTATWESLKALGALLASARMPPQTEHRFDASVEGAPAQAGKPIRSGEHYFGLTLHELWLSKGREWWAEFDPLVFFSMSFDYGNETVTASKLIGPSALKGKITLGSGDLPHGFRVAGIDLAAAHPFRGGQVTVTAVLYKVKRTDFAKKAIATAETLAGAFGASPQVGVGLRLGGVVANTLASLLDIGDCEPVLGHHVGLNTAGVRPLLMQHVALLAGDIDVSTLAVKQDRLAGSAEQRLDGIDHLLYSVWGHSESPDVRRLPLDGQLDKMSECALAGDDISWAKCKSILMSVYLQLLASPDLFKADADRIFADLRKAMLDLRASSPQLMSAMARPAMKAPVGEENRAMQSLLDD